ncbi:MAG: hypothetical protein IJD43_15130 [Thermoguttaceae bacterium]|nr:hypothetical protein [Thermoguttaceae bacterium]
MNDNDGLREVEKYKQWLKVFIPAYRLVHEIEANGKGTDSFKFFSNAALRSLDQLIWFTRSLLEYNGFQIDLEALKKMDEMDEIPLVPIKEDEDNDEDWAEYFGVNMRT